MPLKYASSQMLAHLASGFTTLALCYKLTLAYSRPSNACQFSPGSELKCEENGIIGSVSVGQSFSGACMIRIDSPGTYTIASKASSSTAGVFSFSLMSSGRLAFTVANNLSTTVNHTFSDFVYGRWYFVAFGYDTVLDRAWIKLDQLPTEYVSDTTGPTGSASDLKLGTNFKGSIDSFGYWNRPLTNTELDFLYANGLGVEFKDLDSSLRSGLLAWYDLQELSGTRSDSARQNHLSSVTGSPVAVAGPIQNFGIIGFTSHYKDLEFGGTTYRSVTDIKATSLQDKMGTSVGNSSIIGQLSSPLITEKDLRAGRYDYGKTELIAVNYRDLSMGSIFLAYGEFGEVQKKATQFEAEIRLLSQRLTMSLGEETSKDCRTEIYSSRCKLSRVGRNFNDVVDGTKAFTNNSFYASTSAVKSRQENDLSFGKLTWLTGQNEGLVSDVKTSANGTGLIRLQLKTPYPIQSGDRFNIEVGCDGRFERCKQLGNAINFQGNPHIRGNDYLMRGGQSNGSS